MATLALPDGRTISFPDGLRPEQIGAISKAAMAQGQQPAAPAKTWGETGMDALHSLGTGIAEGAIGLAGLPGDMAALENAGLNKLFGTTPEEQAKMAAMGVAPPAPTSSSIQGKIEGVTGKFYEPQTTIGKYANTVGQMVPAAAMGPGSLARRGAMAVVPGMASEAAGQAAEMAGAPDVAPWARLAGGLAGGVGAARIGAGGELAAMRKAAPTQAANKADKNALYQALQNAGIKYDANGYGQMVQGLDQTLAPKMDDVLHPMASRVLERVRQLAGQSPTFDQMDTLKQLAGGVLRSAASDADKHFAGRILDNLTQFENNAALISNGSLPAGLVSQVANQARELARRDIIAKQIGEMERKGENTVAGYESGMRNKFSSYLQSNKGKGLTPTEEASFQSVVNREGVQNLMHMAGSRFSLPAVGFALGSVVPGLGHVAGAAAGIGTHLLSRKLMEKLTEGAVNRTRQTILAGRDAQSAATNAVSQRKTDTLARVLLSGAGSAEAAKSKPIQLPPLQLPNGSTLWNPTPADYQQYGVPIPTP